MTTPTVALPGDAGSAGCAFLRHEKLALAMQMSTMSHHSLHSIGRADAFTQTVTYAASVDDHITPDPAATRAATSAPSPVVEHAAQAPYVTCAAPARMAPVIKYMASARLAPSFCGLVNPQFSSGTKMYGGFCAPESTRSILGLPSGLEQVRVQEIPEIQIPERIQELTVPERIEEQIGVSSVPQIVEDTVEARVTERVQELTVPERSEKQIGDVPVSRNVEDTVEVVIGNVRVKTATGPVGVSTSRVDSQAR